MNDVDEKPCSTAPIPGEYIPGVAPWTCFTLMVTLVHCPRLGSYSIGFQLPISRLPQGFALTPTPEQVGYPQGYAHLLGQTWADWGGASIV